MSFVWDSPPDQVFQAMADAYASDIHKAVEALARRYTVEIEAWMKDNAPWTDRTANARQTLSADVESVVNTAVEVVFSHGVEYGKYLEFANAGRYAIITPALDHFTPLIWRDVQELLR